MGDLIEQGVHFVLKNDSANSLIMTLSLTDPRSGTAKMELTTWPKHQNVFYHISSSGLSFEVKAPANAAIGLAQNPGTRCDYWIGIGDDNRCWIKKSDEHTRIMHIQTSTILSANSYNRFWLVWGPVIKLGQKEDSRPLVTYANQLPHLRFVTFSVLRGQNPVHWRFELAPARAQRPLKPVSGGKLTWVEVVDEQLPAEAFIGGHEKESLYIIRAAHRRSLIPGKYAPSKAIGYISSEGDSYHKINFQVLCGFDCKWVPTREDLLPIGAVEGGYSEGHREMLFVGRAYHNGHLIPGKIQPSSRACFIAYEHKELTKKRFEVLVEPTYDRCMNNTCIPEVQIDSASESDPEENST